MLEGRRIFIVEDDTRNRVIYHLIMQRHNIHVSFDKWGRDSLQRLRYFGKVDLIILDLMISGGQSGFDIFQTIRSDDQFNDVPIVAISAMDAALAIPKAQELGFDGFISKPINDDIFPDLLDRMINGEKIWYVGGLEL